MKTYNSKGFICIKDEYGITYAVCLIEYFLNDDDTFKYVFKPNYSVISLLETSIFQGIPGLNLDLKKETYERENRVPTFISERVPSSKREDYYDLLSEVGLEYMDPIEYLIRTKMSYSGDNFFVIPYFDKSKVTYKKTNTINTSAMIREILEEICLGNDVILPLINIDDNNRMDSFKLLNFVYKQSISSQKEKQKEGIIKAKKENKYKGRKPIYVDELKFIEIQNKVENKEININQASKILGISRDKYYRFKKSLEK